MRKPKPEQLKIWPFDPSPTAWDFTTWGFYCDTCEKFFDPLVHAEIVPTAPGNSVCYRHKLCGLTKTRYITYDRSKSRL